MHPGVKQSPVSPNPSPTQYILRPALFWDFTLCNIPEERRSHLHQGGSLKSRVHLSLTVPRSDGVLEIILFLRLAKNFSAFIEINIYRSE